VPRCYHSHQRPGRAERGTLANLSRRLCALTYRVTDEGLRTALFFTRVYARVLRPGLARIVPSAPPGDPAFRPYFDQLSGAVDRWIAQAKLVA